MKTEQLGSSTSIHAIAGSHSTALPSAIMKESCHGGLTEPEILRVDDGHTRISLSGGPGDLFANKEVQVRGYHYICCSRGAA